MVAIVTIQTMVINLTAAASRCQILSILDHAPCGWQRSLPILREAVFYGVCGTVGEQKIGFKSVRAELAGLFLPGLLQLKFE